MRTEESSDALSYDAIRRPQSPQNFECISDKTCGPEEVQSPALIPSDLSAEFAVERWNLFCVTLYNESWSMLRATLGSVILACEEARCSRSNRYAICVIADGRDRLSEGLWSALTESQCLVESPSTLDGLEIHITRHNPGQLLNKLLYADPPIDGDELLVFVCVKDRNRGKLHSHKIFFETVCARMSPKYCFQLDTGTILTPDVVRTIAGYLDESPEVAAIAPCITPPIPGPGSSLRNKWQYHDFAFRQAALFPLESALGVLSVMPGQASAFRWSALRTARQAGVNGADPLRAYLYGIAARNSLRELMYLSEDRIIGNAILLDARKSWKLRYVPEVTAFTDSCETLAELFRQRRRWMNSTLVCRLWLMTKWRELLRLRGRQTGSKIRQSLAVLLQASIGVREFTAPAQLIALLLALQHIAQSSSGIGKLLFVLFAIAAVVELCAFALEAFVLSNRSFPGPKIFPAIASWLSSILFVAALVVSLPAATVVFLLAPHVVAIACMALVLPQSSLMTVVKTQLQPIQCSVVFNALLSYSLWNMNDASWGTKGLTSTPATGQGHQSLAKLRSSILMLWLGINAVAVAVATLPGFFSEKLNPIVEATCLGDLVIAGMNWLWLIVRKVRRGARSRKSRSAAMSDDLCHDISRP